MVRYLRLRLRMEDWHGVRDAAADLEQIDARIDQGRPLSECARTRGV